MKMIGVQREKGGIVTLIVQEPTLPQGSCTEMVTCRVVPSSSQSKLGRERQYHEGCLGRTIVGVRKVNIAQGQ